jgi:hypothetical protein
VDRRRRRRRRRSRQKLKPRKSGAEQELPSGVRGVFLCEQALKARTLAGEKVFVDGLLCHGLQREALEVLTA